MGLCAGQDYFGTMIMFHLNNGPMCQFVMVEKWNRRFLYRWVSFEFYDFVGELHA